MKAIIPMAGRGTRLRPLTHSKPKALLRVGAKPILGHIMDGLVSLGIGEVVPIISVEGGDIIAYLEAQYPSVKVHTVVQEEKLGLGHAVGMTEKVARGEEVVIMYGDTIIDGDMTGLMDRSVDGVFAVKEVADPRRFGVVNVRDGYITRFVEKPETPESNLAIIGLNYIKDSAVLFDCIREVIDLGIKTKGEYQITDAFQRMVERGMKLKTLGMNGWFDAGTQDALLETNVYMLSKDANRDSLPGSVILPPVFIPDSATITSSIIGPNVTIGEHAAVEGSIIADSIINDNARVHNAVLTCSLIGNNATVNGQSKRLVIGDHSSIEFG